MYIRKLSFKCLTFSILAKVAMCEKISPIYNLTKNRPMEAEFFHAEGHAVRHDDAEDSGTA
jgi:hypothetical protein